MIVILAGYTEEMEILMRPNQCLRGRFPTQVIFPYMQTEHCLKHLKEEIRKVKVEIWDKSDRGEEKRKKVLPFFLQAQCNQIVFGWPRCGNVGKNHHSACDDVFNNEDTEGTLT